MPLWVVFTLLAAFAQNVRSALQRNLAAELTATGAAYVRFVYGLPLAAFYLLVLSAVLEEPLPAPTAPFAGWVLVGGAAQALGAVLLVRLFSLRVFAIGTAYSKTETVQTALIGFILLGERVGPLAWAGILISLFGVMAISVSGTRVTVPGLVRSLGSPVALTGLATGAAFALASVCYRAAALALPETGFAVAAATTLLWVLVWQSLLMTAWLFWKDRRSLAQSFRRWRPALLVGAASVIGSIGWFTAFALQNAAYVKALGQIELVFALATSAILFKERTRAIELAGIALVVAGLVLIVL